MRNCSFGTEEYWNKIARLGAKLVNILQGNKTVTFGTLISTNHKCYASTMDKNLQFNIWFHKVWTQIDSNERIKPGTSLRESDNPWVCLIGNTPVWHWNYILPSFCFISKYCIMFANILSVIALNQSLIYLFILLNHCWMSVLWQVVR